MSEKSTTQLIEERVHKLDEHGGAYADDTVYRYHCMSTGMMFETRGEPARVSPYTGGQDIQEQTPADFQKTTDVPANQKNQQVQTPLMPNPVPAPGPYYPQNTPWAGNPAPDATGVVGATTADSRGFVPYPQQSMQPGTIPPHVNKAPGEKT